MLSLQVGVDHFDELVRGLSVKCSWILLGVDEMCADMVFDHLGHQPRDAAAISSRAGPAQISTAVLG